MNDPKALCQGTDLYDMWPEAFTFGDLFQMMKGYKNMKTATDLPYWVVLNHHYWQWLLPGIGTIHK